MADKKITELTLATPEETDVIPFVDISDTTMGISGTTKKATKADLKGEKGDKGDAGNGIASIVKTSTVGLTDTYTITFTDSTTTTYDVVNGEDGVDGTDGTNGTNGTNGVDGDDAYVYIAYASDDTGTNFTTTFNDTLDYIAIKTTTTLIASPQASDFVGLWKNYKGVQGIQGLQGIQGIQGVAGNDGLDVTWLGEYNAGTTYVVNDAVSYNGSSYICKLESTGNLPTDTTYFDLMAQKGTDGAGSGDVIAPATNTDSYIPQWDGANSKTLKNGIPTSTFETAKGVDDFYVTSAEKTKLSNLSGNNTGDQDATDFDIKDLTDSNSLRSTWSGKQDALGFTPENVVNKRTSFQATPTDTAYPSEKLVKDSLDLKANLSGATFTGAVVTADHGTATNPEVVAVVYGTGTPPTANTTPIGTLFIKYTT